MNIVFIVNDIHCDVEPMGIGYLSEIAKRMGHSTFLIDVLIESDPSEKIRQISPEIMAYSISSVQSEKMIKTNKQFKASFDFISIFGGAHPTFFPEMIEEEGVDIICRSEGEEAFAELLLCLEQKKDYSFIENLWIKKKSGEIIKNDIRPFIEDLDNIPYPDRSIFRDVPRMKARNYLGFLAGRGCPHKCSFCFNHILRRMVPGKYVRLRSVDNLLEEVGSVVEQYGLEGIVFYDDMFGFDLGWLKEFSKKYPVRIGVPFFISMRADYLNEERALLLSKSGCRCIAIGVESGNDQIRNLVLNKNLKSGDIIKAQNMANKYNIRTLFQNIVGVPGETIDTVLDTIALNVKCSPDKINLSFFTPFPKLDLTQLAIERGEYSCENGIIPNSIYDGIVLDLKDKEEMRFLGCMIFTVAEFPVLFPIVRFLFKQKNKKLREVGKSFLLRFDNFLQKFPNRKTSKRITGFEEYWK